MKKHKIDLVVVEACGPSSWVNELAVSHGLKTLVCSTNEDVWRWSNVKRKTDKDDAIQFAEAVSMQMVRNYNESNFTASLQFVAGESSKLPSPHYHWQSNPIHKPRSGDKSLALGERSEPQRVKRNPGWIQRWLWW